MLRWLGLALGLCGCARGPLHSAPELSAIEAQQRRAAVEGPDQTLERARLASLALAQGQTDLAEATLRQVVGRMQDFRADGEFRALVGAESSKEWKGDPAEKMMAFLYLGLVLLEKGDYGNALAMSKSAILADTGTSRFQYRADFVPASVLKALAYLGLGKPEAAERAIEEGVQAASIRVLTDYLAAVLVDVELEEPVADPRGIAAARELLLAGLPAGLFQHPRDPDQAISGALSRATDLRGLVLTSGKRQRDPDLQSMRRSDAKRALQALSPLTEAWREAVQADPTDPLQQVAGMETFLRELVDRTPRLVLWLESGRAPDRIRTGRYGEVLRLVPRPPEGPPDLQLDGRPLHAEYLDSVAFQATTRGSRGVDGFLKGKAVYKDTSSAVGVALVVAGDIARSSARQEGQSGEVGTALQVAGALLWLSGALTNPSADLRAWTELPDQIWLVRADPEPGEHTLIVGSREYTVQIPDRGIVTHLIPQASPGGVPLFGTPCRECLPAPAGALAVPHSSPR